MDDRGTTLTERITFAEDWLDRARLQIENGRVERGALTLLLAEAELQRARETGLPAPAGSRLPRSGAWTAWVAFGALAVAAAILAFTFAVASPLEPVDAHVPALEIVQLSPATGDMLRIVTVPGPVVERTVVQSKIVRVAVPVPAAAPVRQQAAPSLASPPQSVPSRRVAAPSARVAPVVPAPQVAVPPAPAVTTAVLSDAEVIEMVLAAERSLRRTGNQ
jgi:hypothetical protein